MATYAETVPSRCFLWQNYASNVLLVAKLGLPVAALATNEHKNPDFVLGKKGNSIGNTGNGIGNTANGIGKTGKWHRKACREGQLSFDFRPSGN